jgi:hypothetical protein
MDFTTDQSMDSTTQQSTDSTTEQSMDSTTEQSTVSQDELDYAHNVYLLALATTKLQEKVMNQTPTLQYEVERKCSHLAAVKKHYEEVKYLSRQSQLLHREKALF